jgi:hypothetical protein
MSWLIGRLPLPLQSTNLGGEFENLANASHIVSSASIERVGLESINLDRVHGNLDQ